VIVQFVTLPPPQIPPPLFAQFPATVQLVIVVVGPE